MQSITAQFASSSPPLWVFLGTRPGVLGGGPKRRGEKSHLLPSRIAQLIHTRASAPLRVQPAPYPAPPLMQPLGDRPA